MEVRARVKMKIWPYAKGSTVEEDFYSVIKSYKPLALRYNIAKHPSVRGLDGTTYL